MRMVEIKVENTDDGKITFSCICPLCGKKNVLELPWNDEVKNGLKKWNNGALIQNAFPFLNPSQREFFLTGNCSCIWG